MDAVPTRRSRVRAILAWIPGMESGSPERRPRVALAGQFMNSEGLVQCNLDTEAKPGRWPV